MTKRAKVLLAALALVAAVALMQPKAPQHQAGECLVGNVATPDGEHFALGVIIMELDEKNRNYNILAFPMEAPQLMRPMAVPYADFERDLKDVQHVDCDTGAPLEAQPH